MHCTVSSKFSRRYQTEEQNSLEERALSLSYRRGSPAKKCFPNDVTDQNSHKSKETHIEKKHEAGEFLAPPTEVMTPSHAPKADSVQAQSVTTMLQTPDAAGSMHDADPFLDEVFRKMNEIGATRKHEDVKEIEPPKTLVTLPNFYSRDVDKGHLNSRGWVLQERLLAPRTIHFTENHIYCEDQDDICGEDWVRRQFTWQSCIEKKSELLRNILFPEDSIRSTNLSDLGSRATQLSLQRAAFGQDNYRHMTDSRYSWLKIAEIYIRCRFSYQTDKAVAMAGLLKRKQKTEEFEESVSSHAHQSR